MVNLVMNIAMGLSISLVVLMRVHAPITPDVVVQSWFNSFVIGYAFGDLVPIANAGPALCAKLGVRSTRVFTSQAPSAWRCTSEPSSSWECPS